MCSGYEHNKFTYVRLLHFLTMKIWLQLIVDSAMRRSWSFSSGAELMEASKDKRYVCYKSACKEAGLVQ